MLHFHKTNEFKTQIIFRVYITLKLIFIAKLYYIFFCIDSDKTVLSKLISTNVILACHYDW
jgi:hypothetical protein